jgi:hypothetical protein
MGFRLTTKAVRPLVVFRTMTTLMLQSYKRVLQTRVECVAGLKVSKSRKQLTLFSILPKNERKTSILIARAGLL